MTEKNELRRTVISLIICFAFALSVSTSAQPAITQDPESQVRAPGRLASFSVAAVGAQPLQYQWERDGVPIPNARGASLRFVAAPARAGTYRAIVRDASGQQSASSPAALEVRARPRIVLQPRSLVVREHETAVFEVQLNDSGPFTYINWYNYNPVEGSHAIPEGAARNVRTTRLEVPNSLNAFNYNGTYWIAVSNEVGGTVSRKVTLKVVSPPQLYSGPEDRSVARGASVSFSVSVVPDNAGAKRYQWYKNGQPMTGATGRVLRLLRVQPTHQGSYYCVVSSVGGSVESNIGTLTVL
jgi:hypothetical protein